MNILVVSIIAVSSIVSIEMEANIATCDDHDKMDFKVQCTSEEMVESIQQKGAEKCFHKPTAADLEEAAKGCCHKNTQQST